MPSKDHPPRRCEHLSLNQPADPAPREAANPCQFQLCYGRIGQQSIKRVFCIFSHWLLVTEGMLELIGSINHLFLVAGDKHNAPHGLLLEGRQSSIKLLFNLSRHIPYPMHLSY